MSDFQENLIKWLMEMQMQCKVKCVKPISTHLVIYKNELPDLNIVLVTLKSWMENGNSESWQHEINAVLAMRIAGEKCIIIWEDYWLKNAPIVKSRLNAMLGISQKIAARLTNVRRIDQQTASQFLLKNHLNASVSSKTRYGLFLPERYFRVLSPEFEYDQQANELLVAVATFSAPRVFAREEGPFRSFEMVRFASLLNTNVSGGLDKLLTAFIREKNPDDIMTYADREWSEGASYEKVGFERISETLPMPLSLSTDQLERSTERKPDSMTIYNAGSIKFVKTIKK